MKKFIVLHLSWATICPFLILKKISNIYHDPLWLLCRTDCCQAWTLSFTSTKVLPRFSTFRHKHNMHRLYLFFFIIHTFSILFLVITIYLVVKSLTVSVILTNLFNVLKWGTIELLYNFVSQNSNSLKYR